MLGQEVSMPLGIAPSAMQKMAHRDGEKGTAVASQDAGTVMILSTLSSTSIEDLRAAAPNATLWLQLYVFKNRTVTEELLHRAYCANFSAVVLTVDAPSWGQRIVDVRNAFTIPEGITLGNFDRSVYSNFDMTNATSGSGLTRYTNDFFDQSLTWKDVLWLKNVTSLPVVLKGIMSPEDAQLAVHYGVQGIIVSNHGGRQLDGVPSTIEALPAVVNAVRGALEVYLDGGVRTGTDVIKALALGARGVFVGRPALWGLAYNGTDGVRKMLDIFLTEINRTLALMAMKFNGALKQYVPLPQSQSDDELMRLDERRAQRRSNTVAAASVAASANGRSGGAHECSVGAVNVCAARLETKLVDGGCPDWSGDTGPVGPMSVWRKLCLALSLAGSALFVLGLGWLLPCRYGSLQPLESVPSVLEQWTHLYQGLVLTSNVEASFEGDGERECTVHLGFRQYAEHGGTAPSVGVAAVNGMTGTVVWRRELYATVTHQQCLPDVCFVLGDGSNSLLAALNKSTGAVLWYAHDHGQSRSSQLAGGSLQSISDFLIVPDCNEDGLPDLVVSLQVERPDVAEPFAPPAVDRALALVSQDDGRLLRAPLTLPQCQSVPRILGSLEHGRNVSHDVDIFVHCLTGASKGLLLKVMLGQLSSANKTEGATAEVIWSKGKAAGGDGLRLVVLQEDEEPSVILAWGQGKLLKLAGSMYRHEWSTDLKLDSPIRSFVAGHFTAFSMYELFVVSDHGTRATLFQLLSASTGHVSWQMQYEGSAARVAHLVPAISRYVDGVLIKATSRMEASHQDIDLWVKKLQEPKYAHYLDTFHGIHDYDPQRHQLVLNTQEEQYFIVDFTNKTVDILARLTVQQLCFGGKCSPDIFSRKENVAMQVLQHRPGSYYLSLATSSANRRSNASVPQDTVVRVALLSHQHPSSAVQQQHLAGRAPEPAEAAAGLLLQHRQCCQP
ncbi:uncharacterized protein LOC144100790 isoform X2 [Amblyomma americanum]